MSGAARAMLRMSIGYLLVIWGVDKLVNPAHGLDVSDHFYLGVFTFPGLMPVFGIAELILGGLVIVGVWRRYTYPVVVIIAAITAAGVWRSIADPWGWYLQGANALLSVSHHSRSVARAPRRGMARLHQHPSTTTHRSRSLSVIMMVATCAG